VTMLCILIAITGMGVQQPAGVDSAAPALVCSVSNDLYRVLQESGIRCARYENPADAIEQAAMNTTVMILADGYPQKTTTVDQAVLYKAAEKRLWVYIEYPAALPGIAVEPPKTTQWERLVVATDTFGTPLPKMRILAANGCRYTPVQSSDPLLVVGRVAGYDTAVFGLPAASSPVLFEVPEQKLIVAATCLSRFVTGRFAPTGEWKTFWTLMLKRMCPELTSVELKCEPIVRPAYGPKDTLPKDAERRSIRSFA